MKVPRMLKLTGILETPLYVGDLARACAFYERLFELRLLLQEEHFCAYEVTGCPVLLLFERGSFLDTQKLPGGNIPPHDGGGHLHVAFGVETEQFHAWEVRLSEQGIRVEGRMNWPHGGRSLFFRDPDGHLLELLEEGSWPIR